MKRLIFEAKKYDIAVVKFAYCLLLPSLIIIFSLSIYPLIYSIYISFYDFSGLPPSFEFCGLENFKDILNSAEFRQSSLNTFYFAAVSIILEIIVGLGIALLLNEEYLPCKILRRFIIFPWSVPTIVNAIMWQWIYNPNYGALNGFLKQVGLIRSEIMWLGNKDLAMNMIIIADAWRMTPFYVVMFLAALQTIPQELYEAAKVDGADALHRFLNITLYHLKPILLVLLVLRTTQTLRVFDIIYVLTFGGPANSTMTLSFYIWRYTFGYFQWGYGAAASAILAGIIILFVYAYLKLLKVEV